MINSIIYQRVENITDSNQGTKRLGIMGRGCIFRRLVSEDLTEKLTSEQRLEGHERATSHMDFMEKSAPNRKQHMHRPWCWNSPGVPAELIRVMGVG